MYAQVNGVIWFGRKYRYKGNIVIEVIVIRVGRLYMTILTIDVLLSRLNHHQGYMYMYKTSPESETLRFQRDKHLVNTRKQRESVSSTDDENRR